MKNKLVLLVISTLILSSSTKAVGTGSFFPHPTTTFFGGGESHSVALGDLDGDGDLDAVVANAWDEAETVWVNDGAGGFTAHPTTPAFGAGLGSSVDVALGDLDGDGDLDAVVANLVDAPETVWVNDGAGNLTPHPTSPTFGTGDSLDVALGDLDGDGDLDAVIANAARDPETAWINDGAGSFTPHPTIPAFGADASFGVALGDLDGDGDLDAVVANIDVQAETVWVNDGTGGFTPHSTTPAFGADASTNVSLGDLDGDGDLDAIVANGSEQPETVWVNDGTGSFTPHPTAPAFGAQTSSTAVLGDLDGDGDLDVVVANAFDEAETVWVNDGCGQLHAPPDHSGLRRGSEHRRRAGGPGRGRRPRRRRRESEFPDGVGVVELQRQHAADCRRSERLRSEGQIARGAAVGQRCRRRLADLHHRDVARSRDAHGIGRIAHLHARPRVHRPRQLHVQGERRGRGQRHRHRLDQRRERWEEAASQITAPVAARRRAGGRKTASPFPFLDDCEDSRRAGDYSAAGSGKTRARIWRYFGDGNGENGNQLP